MFFETIALLAILAILLRSYFKWKYSFWERKGVPYIKPKIPFGNIEINRKDSVPVRVKKMYDQHKALGSKHCGIFFVTRPLYFPIDVEIIRSILTKNFHNFTDRGLFSNEEAEPITGHLFFLGGSKWRNLRNQLTPTFTSGKMKNMFSIMVECGRLLTERINKHVNGGQAMETKDVFSRFSVDVIGSCAFGLDCNSFKEDDSPFRKYGSRFLTPSRFRFFVVIFSASFPALAAKLGLKTLDPETTEFFTRLTMDMVKNREETKSVRNDFLQLLIELKNNTTAEGKRLTMEQLTAQAFVFFVAGFETSSTAMGFCLYELALNKEIQDKVRREIKDVLGRFGGKLTYEAVQDMKYLGQVFDETLRKYPPLGILHRLCTNPCLVEEAGIKFEKKQRVMISILGLHHDPEYFPEPEKFDPERFSPENRSKIKPYTYMPFGEGPRQCIGLRFGVMQSKIGLITALKDFEFTLNSKTKVPLQMDRDTTTLSAKGGIWLNVKKLN